MYSMQKSYTGGTGSPLRGSPSRTTYNAPGYGVTSGLESLVGGYNVAYNKAKAANEARYQEMLGIADQTTGQRASDIQGAYQGREADMMQKLARQGLGGTTIAPTMRMGVEREKQSALDRLSDQMQQTKLGIMERRTDEYPDLAGIQSIIAGVGSQYGGGQGIEPMLRALSGLNR